MKIKRRHTIMNKLATPFITSYIKKKFNYTWEPCDIKPPFIVVGNHTTDYDAFFLKKSFKNPIYFVMSDHITTLKVGKLIRFLVAPIPITKSSIDVSTTREIFDVRNQGGAIGLFPEGNKSFAGDMSWIKPSTAKLFKKLGVPVVIYNIEGGYLSSPRWTKDKRKGRLHGFVRRIISTEELNKWTTEEIYKVFIENIRVNAYDVQAREKVAYIGDISTRTNNIETMLYICPKCKQVSSLKGDGPSIVCSKCGLTVTMDEYGYLAGTDFTRLDEWDRWQKQQVKGIDFDKINKDEPIISDEGWKVGRKINKYKTEDLGGMYKSTLYKEYLELKNEKDRIEISIPEIIGSAIEGVNGVQLWLKNGDVYRLKNDGPISGLKYVNYIDTINKKDFKF